MLINKGVCELVKVSFGQIQNSIQSNLISLVLFNFHNFFLKLNPTQHIHERFGLIWTSGLPFKFDLFFFLFRITILYHDSSRYLIQLIQYYQMYESSKINSFNIINIIF